ncbi:3'-5' RNA helicase YTHDC2-like isoform X1 [Haliotis asinina]|uniref:3'-5' RNA helicase YTHDC2-like isoform X1 n=1 Tax=Haliotis asinina TaxID=109174 RepID=UPI00353257E3
MAARDRSGRPQNGNSRHYQEAPGSYNAAFNRGSFQRLDTSSPRPSSVGSVQSVQGLSTRGPRPNQPICIGEEVRIGIHLTVERFKLSENQKELEFPSSLSATERAYIHRLCDDLGMKSKSRGKGANRFLTIYKKDSNQAVSSASGFQLSRNSRQQAVSLLQRFPLSNKERQDLQPKTQKSPIGEVTREFSKMTTGRLNNGVPQVPPSRNETDLDAFREGLPIQQLKDDIIYATSHNQVLLVAGETGSGKTTQVPQMILDDCNKNNKPCRIFCTQPRRIAALSIAERVAQERGERIGQTVGYQIRLESKVSPKTLLTFCTNGVLLRTLMGGDSALGTLTHIIVDEVHERDRISDFLLAVVKDLLHKYKNLRLILMSAALNTEMFIKYFSGCPVAYVPGTLFPVEEHFLEDVLKWTGYTNKKMEKYRIELSKVKSQQEHLDEWCTQGVSLEGHRASMDEDFTVDRIIDNRQAEGKELGEEREDLEPWIVKEMDKLLSEVWLSGEEEVFSQIFHLIMAENVSVDYKHSETSATPLMIAAGRGLSVTVEQLLNLGANINVRASNEWTALDWAKKFNRNDIVEMLEAYVASIECGSASEDGKEEVVVSAEDRELLNVYHHSFDDEKVDTDLISALIYAIMSSKKEGAILVFLPGYDDIVTLRDNIAEDKKFESFRYVLYTLHSSIQSNDQRKVFKMAPQGVRKIILSTNIAETSVTVNDVVFVIDSGKVKEKSFDALSSCSMLKSNWISKASCLQRKGRAGRCRPGFCYHMFSRIRYSSMQEYQQPEILRYPLQELCLNTKLLAPVNMSIADFLAKCPEPPSFLVTRNAVQLLKQMDALDTWEDLTELGHHLTDLPVEPRLGKMVLYSVVLKCLDPILTIVCALAYKDPFTLPSQPYQKRSAAMARRKFASGTFSDHMALLRAFQAWQKARTEGWEKSFCERNFLSSACMEMIVGMRTQLLGQLRASGFVRARGGGDIRDLNTNSENWAVVKAALCAGMYPNIACVDRNRNVVVTQKESKVRFHSQSVLSPAPTTEWVNGASTHAKSVRMLPGDWLIYEEMTRFSKMASAKCCTVLSAVAVAIFAGPSKLPPEAIREAEGIHEHEAGDGMYADHSSDSEGEDKEDLKKSTLQLDDWLCFRLDKESANLVLQLRQKWHSLFQRRMKAPSKPWSQMDEAVVRAVINVLTNEEQSQGLQQPAGIGQRPRPMSAESMMMSGSSRGYIEVDDHQGKYNNRRYPGTPPKRKDINLKGSKTSEDRLETSSVHSNSASNSSANSLKGSAGSTPCPSPQPSSPSKWAERDPGGSSSHPCRLFVMKCNNQKNLDISLQKGLWATSVSNEKKLNKAFQDGKTVYLIFSIQGSGHFQGYAKMLSEIRKDKSQDFISPGLSGSFAIEWVKRAMIPFQSTHHLTNPWNENKKVQVSRDGQEIEPSVGEALLKLWDKYPNYQKRSSPSSGTKVILKHNNSAPPKLLSKDCDMPEQKDNGDSDSQAESGPAGTATKSSSSASLTRSNSSTSSQGSGHSSNTPTSQQGHYQGSHGGQGHYQGHGHNHHHQQQQNRRGGGGGHYVPHGNMGPVGGHHGGMGMFNQNHFQHGYNHQMGYMGPMMHHHLPSSQRGGISPVMILQRGSHSSGHGRGNFQGHQGYNSGPGSYHH